MKVLCHILTDSRPFLYVKTTLLLFFSRLGSTSTRWSSREDLWVQAVLVFKRKWPLKTEERDRGMYVRRTSLPFPSRRWRVPAGMTEPRGLQDNCWLTAALSSTSRASLGQSVNGTCGFPLDHKTPERGQFDYAGVSIGYWMFSLVCLETPVAPMKDKRRLLKRHSEKFRLKKKIYSDLLHVIYFSYRNMQNFSSVIKVFTAEGRVCRSC